MYRDMVRDKKLALAAGAESAFPGGKYPNLFFFYLIPGLGHTAAENEKELDTIIGESVKEKVDDGVAGAGEDAHARGADPATG